MKLVRAKLGCEGCYFEEEKTCPGYKKYNDPDKFKECTQDGVPMIFIEEGDNNDESGI